MRRVRRALALGVPANVLFLGIVSFLTDISSEMTLTLLPLFLANVLGTPMGIIGLIEGVADSTSALLRVLSGYWSDRVRKRKPLTLLGYGLSTLAKPFLYLASNWGTVLVLRFTDRVGKGVRSAPRDALIADSSPPNIRGRSFGLHRTLDTLGAVLGLGIAALVVYLTQRGALELGRPTYQKLVLVGMIPAFVALLILRFSVKESPRANVAPQRAGPGVRGGFDRRFKLFLAIITLFTLGRFSDAFLILRAQSLGLSTFHILLVLVMFNLVYATLSLPSGILSDRWGRRRVLALGWIISGLIYLGFAFARSPGEVVLLFALYGVYYGSTEGVARAYVADLVPSERRGAAFGLYYGLVGVVALPASLLAGLMWQLISPQAPFLLGTGLAGLSTLALLLLIRSDGSSKALEGQ